MREHDETLNDNKHSTENIPQDRKESKAIHGEPRHLDQNPRLVDEARARRFLRSLSRTATTTKTAALREKSAENPKLAVAESAEQDDEEHAEGPGGCYARAGGAP